MNRPNFTQLTSIHEWLKSLNLENYIANFTNKIHLNLSQVLNLEKNDLNFLGVFDSNHQNIMLESFNNIQFELNFQNGLLV